MPDNTLILTVGLPRSGKTTWARQQGVPIVNPDAIRLALHGNRFLSDAEPMVWCMARYFVISLFGAGHDRVIVDATNTTRKRRDYWRDERWATRLKVIDTDKAVCIARAMTEEDNRMIAVIERMHEQFEMPEVLEEVLP